MEQMERIDNLIEQERKENKGNNEVLDIFLLDVKGEGITMLKEEIEQFLKDISINEKEVENIAINGNDNRKTIYRHLISTGVGPVFMIKRPKEVEMIYIQFLKFRQAFKTLNKEQATLFTKKIIELFNQSQCLEQAIEKGIRNHKYGLIFQVMNKEIENIKAIKK